MIHRQEVCRSCHRFEQQSHLSSGRQSFALIGAKPHYAPDRPFKIEHICLDLKVDPENRWLSGWAIQKVRVIAPHQKQLRLDQVGLNIEEVQLDQKNTTFKVNDLQLIIHLNESPAVGMVFEVAVRYSVQSPVRGIYFTGPDSHYPSKPHQVWTQGQDEDSRYWFPTLDYPNQKATSEVIATVPSGFTALSNGKLLSEQNQGEWVRFHFSLSAPHVTYLITLVVAELSYWEDVGPHGLPVQYFVAPGREDDGRRAFGHTPRMIEVFESKTGVAYPFEKYSQVAVQDFIFGGMENTSSTTQTDQTLHDQRAHLDFSSDPLVAHELAHQWFGNLVTCRDWSHGWLNEGFATFMERVWVENHQGLGGGQDEARYYSYQDLKEHLAEDQEKYRRPIVCNTYIEPIDLFDAHLYQKGGLVIHLMRSLLGDELFWKSISLYLNRHRGGSVETIDLIRAIEDVTGRNMRRFFDEWVFSGGYPEFEVSYQWHDDRKLAEWVIEQKQTEGASSLTQNGVTTPLFHLPVVLEMTLSNGSVVSHQVDLGELRERCFLSLPSQPLMVRFDPGFNIPKTLKFPRSKELLFYQLKNDPDCMGRIEAAQELGKVVDAEITQAIAWSAQNDPFWGVQLECAKILSEIKTESACQGLLQALSVKHPKARRAVVQALGSFKNRQVSEALLKVAQSDESYFVEAEAILAWVCSQCRADTFIEVDQTHSMMKFLQEKLGQRSYREVIRSAVLRALGEIPALGEGRSPHVLACLIEWTKRGHPMDARLAAVRTLGKVLKSSVPAVKDRILGTFSLLVEEDFFRLRMQLVSSLEDSSVSDAIPLMEKIRQKDSDGRVRRAAQVARERLMQGSHVPEGVTHLKLAYEKLEEEHKKFRSWVELHLSGERPAER